MRIDGKVESVRCGTHMNFRRPIVYDSSEDMKNALEKAQHWERRTVAFIVPQVSDGVAILRIGKPFNNCKTEVSHCFQARNSCINLMYYS